MEDENNVLKELPSDGDETNRLNVTANAARPRKSVLKAFDPFYNSPLKPLPIVKEAINVESTSDADVDKENVNDTRQVFGELASIVGDDGPVRVQVPPREVVQTDRDKHDEYLLCMKEYEQFIKELLEERDHLKTELENTKKKCTDIYEKYTKCKEALENVLISEAALREELSRKVNNKC